MANNNNKDKCNVPHLRFPEFTGKWQHLEILQKDLTMV